MLCYRMTVFVQCSALGWGWMRRAAYKGRHSGEPIMWGHLQLAPLTRTWGHEPAASDRLAAERRLSVNSPVFAKGAWENQDSVPHSQMVVWPGPAQGLWKRRNLSPWCTELLLSPEPHLARWGSIYPKEIQEHWDEVASQRDIPVNSLPMRVSANPW